MSISGVWYWYYADMETGKEAIMTCTVQYVEQRNHQTDASITIIGGHECQPVSRHMKQTKMKDNQNSWTSTVLHTFKSLNRQSPLYQTGHFRMWSLDELIDGTLITPLVILVWYRSQNSSLNLVFQLPTPKHKRRVRGLMRCISCR